MTLRERIEALPYLDVTTDDKGGGGRMVALDAVLAVLRDDMAGLAAALDAHGAVGNIAGLIEHCDSSCAPAIIARLRELTA